MKNFLIFFLSFSIYAAQDNQTSELENIGLLLRGKPIEAGLDLFVEIGHKNFHQFCKLFKLTVFSRRHNLLDRFLLKIIQLSHEKKNRKKLERLIFHMSLQLDLNKKRLFENIRLLLLAPLDIFNYKELNGILPKIKNSICINKFHNAYKSIVNIAYEFGCPELYKYLALRSDNIHKACFIGDLNLVKDYIENKNNVNILDRYKRSLLQVACLGRNIEIIEYLINVGIDINFRFNSSETALYWACRKNEEEIADLLLKNGANIQWKSDETYTPLHIACYYGHIDIVKLLVNNGADVDSESNLRLTPLNLAGQKGNLSIVKFFLSNKQNINCIEDNISHVLAAAVIKNRLTVVQFILSKSSDIKKYINLVLENGYTIFYLACQHGNFGIIKYLIENGADINSNYKNCYTPLSIASYAGHVKVVKLLIDKGGDLNIANSLGETPLHEACFAGHIDVVKVLLDNGADIEAKRLLQYTPIFTAIYKGHIDIVRLLLNRGANFTHRLKDGSSLIGIALKKGYLDIAELLIANGSPINLDEFLPNEKISNKDLQGILLRNGESVDNYFFNKSLDKLDFKTKNIDKTTYKFNFIKSQVKDAILLGNLEIIRKANNLAVFFSYDQMSTLIFTVLASSKYNKKNFRDILMIVKQYYQLTRILDNSGKNLLWHAFHNHDIPLSRFLFFSCSDLLTEDTYQSSVIAYVAFLEDIIKR